MGHSVRNPIIIGVAGGTGSGKTTVSQAILDRVGHDRIAYIQHDSYYKDRSRLCPEERAKINFDHPDALETEFMVQHLRELREGHPIEVPVYDFTTHTRISQTHRVEPRRVINPGKPPAMPGRLPKFDNSGSGKNPVSASVVDINAGFAVVVSQGYGK